MGERLLVVDDDNMNLKMAEFILKTKYPDIFCVNSGFECIQALQDTIYDLVLLDIEMPQMNGIETLTKIRKDEKFRDLPVMFLTASADIKDVVAAKGLNACGYVVKPFLPEMLLDKVAEALAAAKPKKRDYSGEKLCFEMWLFAVKNIAQTYDTTLTIYENLSKDMQAELRREYEASN